jgi:predicted DNA-binding WGR domain protein
MTIECRLFWSDLKEDSVTRLEFLEGSSKKFWEIAVEGNAITVRWGRIGADGQTQTKPFATEEKARAEHDKLIAEKLKKGYHQVSRPVGATDSQPAAPRTAPSKPPAAPPAAPAKAPSAKLAVAAKRIAVAKSDSDQDEALKEAAEKLGVEPSALAWQLEREHALDSWSCPGVWSALADGQPSPADVFALLRRCPNNLDKVRKKYECRSQLVLGWPADLDAMTCQAYLAEPGAFAEWRTLPPPARRGMAAVLARLGTIDRAEVGRELAQPVAAFLCEGGMQMGSVVVLRDGELGRMSVRDPRLAEIVHAMVSPALLGPALLEAWDVDVYGMAHVRCFAGAIAAAGTKRLVDIMPQLWPGTHVARMIVELRAEDAGALWALATKCSGYSAKVLRVAAIFRCAAIGAAVPAGWEEALDCSVFCGSLDDLAELSTVVAALGSARARRLVERALVDPEALDGLAVLPELASELGSQALAAVIASIDKMERPSPSTGAAWGIGRLGSIIIDELVAAWRRHRDGSSYLLSTLGQATVVALVTMVDGGQGGHAEAKKLISKWDWQSSAPFAPEALERALAAPPRKAASRKAAAPSAAPSPATAGGPKAAAIVELLRRMAVEPGEAQRLFILEPTGKSRSGQLSQIGGGARGVSDKEHPRRGKKKMVHLATLAYADLPGCEESGALALFCANPHDNLATSPETDETAVVWLEQANLSAASASAAGRGLVATPVDVPADVFDRDHDDEDLAKLSSLLLNAPGFIGGAPLWIQEPQEAGRFIGQLNGDLIDMSLGDQGVLYVFEDCAFWQCS